MNDLSILRLLKYKEAYDRIVPSLPSEALDKRTMILISDIGKFLKETGHPVVKAGAFKTAFFNFYHPKLPKADQAYYNTLIDRIEKDVDDATARMLNNHLVELSFATDVANNANDYHTGKDIDIIGTVGERHERAKASLMRGTVEELFIQDDIMAMLEETKYGEGYYSWRMQALRENLRPATGGDFIIIAGRPDTGKTSCVLSELTYMVPQLPPDRPLIWYNNEGQGNRIVKRGYSAALGESVAEMAQRGANLPQDYLNSLGGNKFHVIDIHDWTNVMVEDSIEQLNPGIVVFDMIDNIEFAGKTKGDRTDQSLESMYQWARGQAVKHDFVCVATSQVSADAEMQPDTQCYPQQHMLKDSKTGKQGAADTIIMIGKSADPSMMNKRFISTPKNKLVRDGKNMYMRAEVNFDMARSRYNDPI